MDWKQRYQIAHEENFKVKYPSAYRDNHYSKPTFPKVATANGLTNAICNFINWNGYVATRINVSGRLVETSVASGMGANISKKKWIKSSTTRGTSDISATIKGKAIHIEIKVGKDKPSEHQITMQERIQSAGGVYEFIGDMESFMSLYDKILSDK